MVYRSTIKNIHNLLYINLQILMQTLKGWWTNFLINYIVNISTQDYCQTEWYNNIKGQSHSENA